MTTGITTTIPCNTSREYRGSAAQERDEALCEARYEPPFGFAVLS